MRNILDKLIDDFHEHSLPEMTPRDLRVREVSGKAIVVIGMRRAGKTWFCYQMMKELMAKGVQKERILYLNFEDERLLPFTASDFELVLETYYGKFPGLKDQKCYLFLDEAQRIGGWDKFVRRVLDTEKLSVIITGSSSRLLSTEIATALRGRSLTTEIFPFSFKEFLNFHHQESFASRRYGSKARAQLQRSAREYLEVGGFPEVQTLEPDIRRDVLRNYLDVVMLRDVVERYGVSNVVALRTLIRHILSSPASRFSMTKFYHSLRSQGIAVSKNNLYEYFDYLSDAFLVYPVEIHSRSQKARQVNPKKMYVVDTGLLHAMSLFQTEDRGALLENLVYMHLRRHGLTPEYNVTGQGNEVDFVCTGPVQGGQTLLQVCWSLEDPVTRKREMKSMLDSMKDLRISHGTIVTWLDEFDWSEDVQIIPVWKWMLQFPTPRKT